MPFRSLFLSVLLLPTLVLAQQGATMPAVQGLRNVTVLIVRHAEKPEQGRDLTSQGEQRATAYASYFAPLRIDGIELRPQRLIATSDSKGSDRPRLTLTPLAARLGLVLEQPYADKQVDELVDSLRGKNTARVVLIAWHHGRMDELVHAFGGDLHTLAGTDHWPGDVYNWLVILRFDGHGQLIASRSKVVHEHVLPGD